MQRWREKISQSSHRWFSEVCILVVAGQNGVVRTVSLSVKKACMEKLIQDNIKRSEKKNLVWNWKNTFAKEANDGMMERPQEEVAQPWQGRLSEGMNVLIVAELYDGRCQNWV